MSAAKCRNIVDLQQQCGHAPFLLLLLWLLTMATLSLQCSSWMRGWLSWAPQRTWQSDGWVRCMIRCRDAAWMLRLFLGFMRWLHPVQQHGVMFLFTFFRQQDGILFFLAFCQGGLLCLRCWGISLHSFPASMALCSPNERKCQGAVPQGVDSVLLLALVDVMRMETTSL